MWLCANKALFTKISIEPHLAGFADLQEKEWVVMRTPIKVEGGGVSSVEGTSEQTPEDARERSRRAKKK